MKRFLAVLLLTFFACALFADAPEASPNYFRRVRDVTATPEKDNYISIDPDIWMHTRTNLADIRLYTADDRQVAYRLQQAELAGEATQIPVHMMELGRAGDGTRFLLDMGSDSEFNRITLDLKAHDFVAQATVDGMHELNEKNPTRLGPFTLFDFTKENLGSNFTLKLPDSRFRYLRVTLSKEIAPSDVKGATVARSLEAKTLYTDWANAPQIQQQGHKTVITWDAESAVPLDRVRFEVEGVNFMRSLRLEAEFCDQKDERDQVKCGFREVEGGEISRIQMTRNGRAIKTEELALSLPSLRSAHYRITIDNGSDVPLNITRVQLSSIERRIYFRPDSANLRLFYGDDKLEPPIYDYAKLFDESQAKSALLATLAAPQQNLSFTARPDDRPWTDRHPALLWVVLIIVVLGLGAVAVRGLKV